MAVNNISDTYLTNYYMSANDLVSDDLTRKVQGAESDEQMMDACRQFESYMIQQMFKTMEESAKIFSDDDEEEKSTDYVDMFQDNYLSSIAEQMVNSGQGLGIAEQLYQSMKSGSEG